MSIINKESAVKQFDTDWFSVWVLAVMAVIFVSAELLPAGILPEISTSFHEPIGRVGLIVTGYAWTVAVSAVFITAKLAALERRYLLLLITLLFAAANFLIALSFSLKLLFIGRILGAFSHGVFWSIVGPLCIRLSNYSSKARSTAIVFCGIAVATVIAVPIGTLLAQWLGWRVDFILIASISLMLFIAIWLRFPKLASENQNSLGQLPRILKHPLLRRLFPATAMALTGHFCAFTYISLLLGKVVGAEHSYLAFYLFLFGGAGVLGNILAGKLADHHLHLTSQWTMITMAIMIILCAYLPLGSSFLAACFVIVWGACICMLTITLQSLILTLPPDITDSASAMYVSMFNTGIGSGALLGGIIIDYSSPQLMGLVAGIILLIAAAILGRRF